MKPRKPLKRGKPIRRSGQRIRSRKADPKRRRFAARRDPAYCEWIRSLPCILRLAPGTSCQGAVECAHTTSRGAGGYDRGHTVPLCQRHHRQEHAIGKSSFEEMYNVDLDSIAAGLAA